MSLSWYVIQSKPNREEALNRELMARGVDVFYPFIRVTPVNPRSRKIRAYFPGYLFVHVDLEKVGHSLIEFCPFAKGLVTFDREPAAVTEELVAAIRRKVSDINAGGQSPTQIKPGTPVQIQSGLFEGYDAIFDERIPGRERVRVLLRLLNNQYRRVELDGSSIKPV